MTLRSMRILLSAALLALFGCGQSLSIKVERIRSVDKADIPDLARGGGSAAQAIARGQAAATSASLSRLIRLINAVAPLMAANHPEMQKARDFVAMLESEVKKDSVAELPGRAVELSAHVRALSDLVSFLQSPGVATNLNLTDSQKAELAELPGAFDEAVVQASALEAATRRLQFGGYLSETIYILAPGSDAYKKLVTDNASAAPERTLVYNRVEALAAGDSVLIAVQDSPAHFSIRYMKADPTAVIKNSLLILTRVLRVAAAYVPLVSGVGQALGAPAAPAGAGKSATAADKTPVAAAEEAANKFDEGIRAILRDAALQDALARLRANPNAVISPADRGILAEKLKLLEAALGAP